MPVNHLALTTHCNQTLAALRRAEEQVRLQSAEAEAARKAARDESDRLAQERAEFLQRQALSDAERLELERQAAMKLVSDAALARQLADEEARRRRAAEEEAEQLRKHAADEVCVGSGIMRV